MIGKINEVIDNKIILNKSMRRYSAVLSTNPPCKYYNIQ
jgi:hypothetical protein